MNETWHILIEGRVQGVYYRANTQKQALKFGLTGYVRNRTDGAVEAVAQGPKAQLEQLLGWCSKGPLLAKVERVTVEVQPDAQSFTDFSIR